MRERGNIPTDKFIADTLYDVLQELKEVRKLLTPPAKKSTKSKVTETIADIVDDGKLNKSVKKKKLRG